MGSLAHSPLVERLDHGRVLLPLRRFEHEVAVVVLRQTADKSQSESNGAGDWYVKAQGWSGYFEGCQYCWHLPARSPTRSVKRHRRTYRTNATLGTCGIVQRYYRLGWIQLWKAIRWACPSNSARGNTSQGKRVKPACCALR